MNTPQPILMPVLMLDFVVFILFFHSDLSVYSHLMYHLTLKMTVLAIVPGKQNSCLQENLVDCADCGGLPRMVTKQPKDGHLPKGS